MIQRSMAAQRARGMARGGAGAGQTTMQPKPEETKGDLPKADETT